MAIRDPGEVRYPWQLPLPPWAPAAKLSEAERRRDEARGLFELDDDTHEFPGAEASDLRYDEEAGYYRFARGPKEGQFALSREHADWDSLKRIRNVRGWEL